MFGLFTFDFWEKGKIEGFPLSEARRHKITGRVEIKYREANETWDGKPAYAQCKDKHKMNFKASNNISYQY